MVIIGKPRSVDAVVGLYGFVKRFVKCKYIQALPVSASARIPLFSASVPPSESNTSLIILLYTYNTLASVVISEGSTAGS